MRNVFVFLMVLIMAGCGTESGPKKETKSLQDFDALWDYNDPGQTELKFRELIPAAKESGDMSYYAQLLTQIARTEGLQGKFEEAHETLDTVEAMLTDELVVAKIRYLLERGRVYNSSGQPDSSKPFFLEAWELGLEHGEDYYAIDAAHMMGIVEPPEKQLEWAAKAIELAEKSKDERARNWLGPLYNNTGWSYHDLGEYDKALELFEKSLKFREEKKDERGTRIAKWTVGRAYRSLGRIDEALQIQKGLEKESEEKGIEQDGYVFEELGECLLLLNKGDEARKYFKLAYDRLSKDPWLAANEAERLERLKKLGAGEK
jgi:tetratricopeptide (TPR) repeat protein